MKQIFLCYVLLFAWFWLTERKYLYYSQICRQIIVDENVLYYALVIMTAARLICIFDTCPPHVWFGGLNGTTKHLQMICHHNMGFSKKVTCLSGFQMLRHQNTDQMAAHDTHTHTLTTDLYKWCSLYQYLLHLYLWFTRILHKRNLFLYWAKVGALLPQTFPITGNLWHFFN